MREGERGRGREGEGRREEGGREREEGGRHTLAYPQHVYM